MKLLFLILLSGIICSFAQDLNTNVIWVPWSTSQDGVPDHAVVGGKDKNGLMYVIRAEHYHIDEKKNFTESFRGKVVGRYSPDIKFAAVPYFNLEYQKENFEVLTHTNYEWKTTNVHKVFIPGGYDSLNDPIYICRVAHKKFIIPGKIHIGSCWISFDGFEHQYRNWETLVKKNE
ncbi:hypothetical protein ACKWTF_014394 [Chironomus riparius]